jgi:hypothetical protein
VVAAGEGAGPEEAVFEMREVSAFDKSDGNGGGSLTRGQYAECSTEPDKGVKAYPKLKSQRPLYGKLLFDRNLSSGKASEFHFVLDESGEAPPSAEKGEEKKAEEKKPETSLLKNLAEKLAGAVEKSAAAKRPPRKEAKLSRYDRLYVDLNRDLDLTNDPVLMPMKEPPWQALPSWEVDERAAFEYLNIDVDYGPGLGVRPFRILPWLTISGEDNRTYSTTHFVATVARKGQIRIGKHEYEAVLAQPYLITGRFDRPIAALLLKPVDPKDTTVSHGFGGDMLMTAHRVDGEIYTISTTPLGDKLTVKPYRGDFGIFAVGPGARDVKEISMQGCLASETMAISVGRDAALPDQQQQKAREQRLPVGDYLPEYLSIKYGRLRIGLSDNYHSDGRPRDVQRRRTFGVTIGKDKPFVLDFSNKPEVLFASPAKEKTFRPGDEVEVKAVLIDPVLGIMIRGLTDTSRKQKLKETVKSADGNETETSYDRELSLDPVVTITDSAGKQVSEGVMPFG